MHKKERRGQLTRSKRSPTATVDDDDGGDGEDGEHVVDGPQKAFDYIKVLRVLTVALQHGAKVSICPTVHITATSWKKNSY